MGESHIIKDLADKPNRFRLTSESHRDKGVIAETSPVAPARMVLADNSSLRCVQRVPSLHNAHTEL